MDDSQIRRRVKAARALAGLSVGQLAKRLDEPGLGERTLRDLESQKGRSFYRRELRAIAEACGLPYEFFTMDFSAAREDSLEGIIEAKVEAAVERAMEQHTDATRDAVGATRQTKRALEGQVGDAGSASEAADGTHAGEDAIQESARSQHGATQ